MLVKASGFSRAWWKVLHGKRAEHKERAQLLTDPHAAEKHTHSFSVCRHVREHVHVCTRACVCVDVHVIKGVMACVWSRGQLSGVGSLSAAIALTG